MKAIDADSTIVEGYVKLLDNLSPSNKLDLISKLTRSIKSDISKKKNSFYNAFGSWESKKSAEDIIDEIRSSRTFNRKMEEF